MPRLHRAIGWSLVGLGTLHVLATPLFVPELSEAAVWFASAGGGLMLVGAVNLLCLDPHALPSLRQLCIAANLGTVAFAAALVATAPVPGSATPAQSLSERFEDPQVFLVFALALGASWLSRSRRADSARPPV